MLNIKNIFTITRKELRAYFDTPTAYVVLIVFLLLWEFLFFQRVFIVNEASLRSFFAFLPWLYLFIIPALTMGSISAEKSEGTAEFLLTHSLKESELVLGKIKAAFIFVLVSLILTLPMPIMLGMFGDIDWGVIMGQYLSSLLLGVSLISLGVFVSSLFRNQISSFLAAAFLGFLFVISGSPVMTSGLPAFVGALLEKMSLISHFESMSRGVLDIRDLLYFASFSTVFIGLAYLELLKRRFGNQKALYATYQLWLFVFIGVVAAINVFGSRIPGRIDLTEGKVYTLSEATKDALNAPDGKVRITLYASRDLPAQFQPILREVKDILRDYKTFGAGKVVIEAKDPSGNSEIASEAASRQIQEVQFNVVGQEELQVKRGYFGIAISFGENHESIPFINQTSDLEYQLTSFIRKLTVKEKKVIGFLSGHGEKGLFSDYGVFSRELETQFDTRTVTIDKENPKIPVDIAALIIAGPKEEIDGESEAAIKEYLDKGGSALFLIDSLSISPQLLEVTKNEKSFAEFLEIYGVKVKDDLVYDLSSNETVSFGSGFFTYLLPYPFWPRVVKFNEPNQITSKIESFVLPWPSSLELNEDKAKELGISVSKLFTTTKFGGRQIESFNISPNSKPPAQGLGENIVAISLIKEADDNSTSSMRMVVVGDSDFISDQFAANSPQNIAFGMEALSWLSQEQSLAGIRLKQIIDRKLLFENNTQKMLIKYGNMAFVVLAPLFFGAWRVTRRRGLRNRVYRI